MKNPLNRDDFENYLEQEVNQHRMYPSDHIWRNIQQDLHGYKKWPALTVITLFVISALVVGTILIKPQYKTIAATANSTAQKADEAAAKPQENLQEHISPEHITQQTIASVTQNIDIDADIQNAFSAYNSNIATLVPAAYSADVADNTIATPVMAGGQKAAAKKEAAHGPERNNAFFNWMRIMPDESLALDGQAMPAAPGAKAPGSNSNFMFSSLDNLPSSTFRGINLENAQQVHTPFKFKPNSRRFDFAFYATPSVSYRRLVYDEKNTSHTYVSGIPYGANYTVDLNRTILHKPAVGYEVGAALGYKLNKFLTLRGGFQFNMREYDIEAHIRNYTPSDIAAYNNSISGGLNMSNQSASSVNIDNKMVVLQNRYYEISMPLGIDLRAWHSGNFSLGFATAIQPTYIFDKDPFIITSDYKNYSDGSALLRKWNINTNVETYLAYTTGKFKWQIGPQFRYQVLSTLSNSYPIREHLLDYGVKIGFVKSLP